MQQTQAEVGIFITLVPISSGMRQLQEDMGTFEHNNRTYNRLQFWQIDEGYFENPHSLNQVIRLPWTIESQRKSERHVGDHQNPIRLILIRLIGYSIVFQVVCKEEE